MLPEDQANVRKILIKIAANALVIGLAAFYCRPCPAAKLTLPTRLEFAGTPVPLDRQSVREQFDAMFTIMVENNRGQMMLWLKRGKRVLPTARKMLETAGVPQDLAYVIVAESDLLPRAKSPAKAYGFWQFMPGTGKERGLAIHQGLDERGDFVQASMAAIRYLKELRADFYNDWLLALAAYNNGPTNIRQIVAAQEAKGFWDCVMNNETAAYVPRIILIKTLFENPAAFGIDPAQIDEYPEPQLERVHFSLTDTLRFARVCHWVNTDYRTLYTLNPHISRDDYTRDAILPRGTAMYLDVPKGSGAVLQAALRANGKVRE